MNEKPIGVLRGVFDPVHEGHFKTIINSLNSLDLEKIYVIVKFIGEKDPSTSVFSNSRIALKGAIRVKYIHIIFFGMEITRLRSFFFSFCNILAA